MSKPTISAACIGGVPEESEAYAKYGKEGENLFMMSLVQIPETEAFWETEIIANAYVKVGNEYTFVTDFTGNEAQVKDIAHVAASAKAAGEEGTIIDQIIEVVSENEELTLSANLTKAGNVVLGIGAEKTADVTVTTTSGYAISWTSANKEVVTVDKTGKVTGVGTGAGSVTATFGSKTVTQSVKVYKESYDFEDGKTSGVQVFMKSSPSTMWHGAYSDIDATVPETFGNYGFRWINGNTTAPAMAVHADYLEYVFADPNVAYVVMDLYMAGKDSHVIRRHATTSAQIQEGTIYENTIYPFSISRVESEALKTTGEDF